MDLREVRACGPCGREKRGEERRGYGGRWGWWSGRKDEVPKESIELCLSMASVFDEYECYECEWSERMNEDAKEPFNTRRAHALLSLVLDVICQLYFGSVFGCVFECGRVCFGYDPAVG